MEKTPATVTLSLTLSREIARIASREAHRAFAGDVSAFFAHAALVASSCGMCRNYAPKIEIDVSNFNGENNGVVNQNTSSV